MPKLTTYEKRMKVERQRLAKKRGEEMRAWLTCEEKAKIWTERRLYATYGESPLGKSPKVRKRMNEGTLYRDTMWSFNILSDEGEWQPTCDCCLPIDIIPWTRKPINPFPWTSDQKETRTLLELSVSIQSIIDELIILRKQT